MAIAALESTSATTVSKVLWKLAARVALKAAISEGRSATRTGLPCSVASWKSQSSSTFHAQKIQQTCTVLIKAQIHVTPAAWSEQVRATFGLIVWLFVTRGNALKGYKQLSEAPAAVEHARVRPRRRHRHNAPCRRHNRNLKAAARGSSAAHA